MTKAQHFPDERFYVVAVHDGTAVAFHVYKELPGPPGCMTLAVKLFAEGECAGPEAPIWWRTGFATGDAAGLEGFAAALFDMADTMWLVGTETEDDGEAD